ncbi:MAG: PKD domain-containing protein [bacterium]
MAGWNEKYSGIIAGTIAAGMLLSLTGCGGTTPSAQAPGPDSRQTAQVMSLDEALAEVDALSTPQGVDPQRFQLLQDELARVLREQGSQRFVSEAPQSQGSAVNDLMITHNADGSADLAWTYRNQGDGDLNSEVNIADLTPIGIHLGKGGASPDWNRARNTDNDGNNEVNISDITPIGSNFLRKVQGYWIQRAVNVDSAWNLVSQVEFSTSVINSSTSARDFAFHINVPADGQFYRVAPYDGGSIGIPSNAVQAQSLSLPGRPNNPVATQGSLLAQVDLSWDPVADVEYYEIQRRTGTLGSFEPLAETTDNGTSYSDTGVVTGQHYFYIVRGWQGDKKTDYSIQFEGWPLDLPTVPQNLAASDGTSPDHVSVSWEASSGADEYVLYHSLEQEGTYTELLHTTELSYDHNASQPDVLNWYYVTAVNAAGETSPSVKDSGYLDGALPHILSVAPLGSFTGDTIEMNAVVQGATPLSWSWDFGDAATPSTSTDENPTITLGDPGDYNCSLTVEGNFANQEFMFQMTVTDDEWVHSFGTAAADEAFDIGVDDAQNVYVIGRAGNIVVAKFNPSGVLQWARQVETTRDTQWASGSVSAGGDVFLAMARDDTDDTSGKGVLNVKLDTDGNVVFKKVYSLGETLILSRFPRTAIDDNGKLFVSYTSYSLVSLEGSLVAYRLSPTGTLEWNGLYDTPSDYAHDKSLADGIAVDSAGNLYIGADEANVTKLDSSGNVLWCKGWGDVAGTPHEHAYTMGVDSNDFVYMAGGANNLGSYQPFLVKLDQSGNISWQKAFANGAGLTSSQIVRMTVDPAGNVYALNPQREDAGEPSRFYMLDAGGSLLGSWEYTSTGNSKIFSVHYAGGKVQFCGVAPDPNGAWSTAADSLADFSLAIEDRTSTRGPSTATFDDDINTTVSEYTASLDAGEGSVDVLLMNLRTDNLLP